MSRWLVFLGALRRHMRLIVVEREPGPPPKPEPPHDERPSGPVPQLPEDWHGEAEQARMEAQYRAEHEPPPAA